MDDLKNTVLKRPDQQVMPEFIVVISNKIVDDHILVRL